MQRSKNGHLRLADLPADYKKLGIAPLKLRSDSHLDNGATPVVVSTPSPMS
jgi:hypothetical protein